MGPDFNNDGRVDGYDMEYLSEPGSGSDNNGIGCGGFGCCSWIILIVVIWIALVFLLALIGSCSQGFYLLLIFVQALLSYMRIIKLDVYISIVNKQIVGEKGCIFI